MVDSLVSFKVSVSSSLMGIANEMLTFYMQLSKSIGLKQSASLITLCSASTEPVDVRSTAKDNERTCGVFVLTFFNFIFLFLSLLLINCGPDLVVLRQ